MHRVTFKAFSGQDTDDEGAIYTAMEDVFLPDIRNIVAVTRDEFSDNHETEPGGTVYVKDSFAFSVSYATASELLQRMEFPNL